MLLALLSLAAITDLITGKIYNAITYPAAALGLILSIFIHPPDLRASLAGFAGALILFGLLRMIAGLGAGDVKLMAAVGAFKGLTFVLLSSFYIFTAGAVLGLFLLARKRQLLPTLRWFCSSVAAILIRGSVPPAREFGPTHMPFGPAILAGVAYSIWLEASRGPLSFGWWF